jgi:hypothetical protein
MALNYQQVNIAQLPVPLRHIMISDSEEVVAMDNKQEHTESQENREVQKLVKRVEEMQARLETTREAETTRTLDDQIEQLAAKAH